MNILYINDNDLAGRRFNGYDLLSVLNSTEGVRAKQIVAVKSSKSKNVIPLITSPSSEFVRQKCKDFEEKISMQSVIYPFGEKLMGMKEFKEADIVHYHLIFNHFMSLFSFTKLVKQKPSVWTLHDPWALTGHCVHPLDCNGWKTGCKKCPYLDRYSPLREDNASAIWNLKESTYKEIKDIDIIVASEWMYDFVKASPLGKIFKNIHLIPFGIDTNVFKRRENRKKLREQLGIKESDFVIMFRQDPQELKGMKFIVEMLKKLRVTKNVVLLTVGMTKLIDELKNRYKIIEYEWVNDTNKMVDLYSVSDLFLMPSLAESFGMMAVEAMSSSLPVIVSNNAALPSVCDSPNSSIAVNLLNPRELLDTVKMLTESSNQRQTLGGKARRFVQKKYRKDIYETSILNLYKDIHNRSRNERG